MPHYYSYQDDPDPRVRLARVWHAHLRCRDLERDNPNFQRERELIRKDFKLLADEFARFSPGSGSSIPGFGFSDAVPNVIDHGVPKDDYGTAQFYNDPDTHDQTNHIFSGFLIIVTDRSYQEGLERIGARSEEFKDCINYVAWQIHKKGFRFDTPISGYFDNKLPPLAATQPTGSPVQPEEITSKADQGGPERSPMPLNEKRPDPASPQPKTPERDKQRGASKKKARKKARKTVRNGGKKAPDTIMAGPKTWQISDVARWSGIPRTTLQHWQEKGAALVTNDSTYSGTDDVLVDQNNVVKERVLQKKVLNWRPQQSKCKRAKKKILKFFKKKNRRSGRTKRHKEANSPNETNGTGIGSPTPPSSQA